MRVEKGRGQKFSPQSHGRQTEIIYGGKREKRGGRKVGKVCLVAASALLSSFFLPPPKFSFSLPSISCGICRRRREKMERGEGGRH